MFEQPLIGGGAAAAADGAGPATEGDPGVRCGIRGLAARQVRVVLGSQQDLLPPCGYLVARWLLRDHCRAVDVVVLHVQGLHLVNGVDGKWVLEPAVRHPAVQQWLHHNGGGDSGNVVRNP